MSAAGDAALENKSLFVFVGDVSADHHTARLIARLREMYPALSIWGVGGEHMKAQGAQLLYNCQEFATIGVLEVWRLIPFFQRMRQDLLRQIAEKRPDAVLLVDFGGFNLRLAKQLNRHFPELPIIYFISPQVWGSRPWRIKTIARCVKKMLVIFPFEEALYRRLGIDATFVGHPLTEYLPKPEQLPDRSQFCRENALDSERPIVGIFAGSRRREIKDLMPIVLQAVVWLNEERPDVQFVISQANADIAADLNSMLTKPKYKALAAKNVALIEPAANYALMANADLLWAKSGTTTLEAALYGRPMLIFYRGMWLSFLLFLLYKTVQHVGWPNLLAGRLLVPELLQLDCRPEMLVRYTRDWLDVPGARADIGRALASVRDRLGAGDFALNAASEVLKVLAGEWQLPAAPASRRQPLEETRQ